MRTTPTTSLFSPERHGRVLADLNELDRGLDYGQAGGIGDYINALSASHLRLAQGLRVIRDTTSITGYVANVAARALEEAGVNDPPDEDHP